MCCQPPVLFFHVVQLLLDMCQHLDCRAHSPLEANQRLVPLLNAFVVCLVFNLQLFKVNEVEASGQHLACLWREGGVTTGDG